MVVSRYNELLQIIFIRNTDRVIHSKHGTKDGEIMTWPGSRIQFFETIRSVRWEDYKLKTENENRFSYLGNGLAARELDGRDLTWYLGSLSPTLRGSEDDKQPQYSKEDINELLYCE